MQKKQKTYPRIVYFDGVCGICNWFIDFLLKIDKTNLLVFAPLQGETAKENIHTKYLEDISTIIFQENGKIYTKSDAVLQIFNIIGGFWTIFVFFYVFPRFIRDKVYVFIANNRYQWFGKKESCRMPTNEELDKILL